MINEFNKIQVIGEYESTHGVKDRVTDWFGDASCYERALDITSGQVDKAFDNIMATMNKQQFAELKLKNLMLSSDIQAISDSLPPARQRHRCR